MNTDRFELLAEYIQTTAADLGNPITWQAAVDTAMRRFVIFQEKKLGPCAALHSHNRSEIIEAMDESIFTAFKRVLYKDRR